MHTVTCTCMQTLDKKVKIIKNNNLGHLYTCTCIGYNI